MNGINGPLPILPYAEVKTCFTYDMCILGKGYVFFGCLMGVLHIITYYYVVINHFCRVIAESTCARKKEDCHQKESDKVAERLHDYATHHG